MTNSAWATEALESARPAVFWSDRADAPDPAPGFKGQASADVDMAAGSPGSGQPYRRWAITRVLAL
jgi:hypothetical protein